MGALVFAFSKASRLGGFFVTLFVGFSSQMLMWRLVGERKEATFLGIRAQYRCCTGNKPNTFLYFFDYSG